MRQLVRTSRSDGGAAPRELTTYGSARIERRVDVEVMPRRVAKNGGGLVGRDADAIFRKGPAAVDDRQLAGGETDTDEHSGIDTRTAVMNVSVCHRGAGRESGDGHREVRCR